MEVCTQRSAPPGSLWQARQPGARCRRVCTPPQEWLGRGSCSNSLPLKVVVLQTCPPRVWLEALAKAFRGHLSRSTSGGLAQAPLEKNRKSPPGVNSPQVNSLSFPPMQGGGTGPRAKVQYLSQNGYGSLSLSLSLDAFPRKRYGASSAVARVTGCVRDSDIRESGSQLTWTCICTAPKTGFGRSATASDRSGKHSPVQVRRSFHLQDDPATGRHR